LWEDDLKKSHNWAFRIERDKMRQQNSVLKKKEKKIVFLNIKAREPIEVDLQNETVNQQISILWVV